MILSTQLLFSDAQAVTADTDSTNVVDLGVAGTPYGATTPLNQDIGKGCPVCVLIQVVEDFATLTSLDVSIVVSANADVSSGTLLATETILLADLVAGKQSNIQVIPNGADQRYIAVRYSVTGSDATAGAITAGITAGNQTNVTGA